MCSNFSTLLPFIYLCQRKFIYTYIYPGIYTYLVGRNMGWNVVCFLWVIPRRLKFICRSFGTLCLFHLHGQVDASSSFYSHLPAYEDGTDRVSETSAYWIQTPGNHPKKHTIYRTRRKLEIKNGLKFLPWLSLFVCI